jgi:hypothetical protein
MDQADRVHSTPPLSTSASERPPRLPSPQEKADDLLQRWRLWRAAGVPPHLRLDQEAGQ